MLVEKNGWVLGRALALPNYVPPRNVARGFPRRVIPLIVPPKNIATREAPSIPHCERACGGWVGGAGERAGRGSGRAKPSPSKGGVRGGMS